MLCIRSVVLMAALLSAVRAHPMGNFSVNHYSRLKFQGSGVELVHVLDLAEIPTFQLLGSSTGDQVTVDRRVRVEAATWIQRLELRRGAEKLPWQLRSIVAKTADGAGGMAVLRVEIAASAPLKSGPVVYDDLNFPERAGWKEIVIDSSPGSVARNASAGPEDLSSALTVYPTDPTITPPQDLHASVEFVGTPESVPAITSPEGDPPGTPLTLATPATPSHGFTAQQPNAPGNIARGDFLSTTLRRKDLGWRLMLLCVAVAFGLGGIHAMSPGHGKTVVAAYLVGSRGTLRHAVILGLVVTFTHTFTVFLLGLGVLFFQQYTVPEKIIPALGVVSGLSIVSVGFALLYRRARGLMAHSDHRSHQQQHHNHDHHHHDHDHHHHASLTHTHGGSTHTHTIDGPITPSGLILLGIGGGLVPCPSALILMLSAIGLGRPGFGILLLVGFSAGLALVLMAIGALALYARHLLPDSRTARQHRAFRLIPVFSAVAVVVIGLAITAISAGWLRPVSFLA